MLDSGRERREEQVDAGSSGAVDLVGWRRSCAELGELGQFGVGERNELFGGEDGIADAEVAGIA